MTLPDAKRQRPVLDVSKITLRQCTALLKQIKGMPEAAPFLVPVDPVALRIPDYPTIVKSPMDLGTIDKKLTSSSYHDVESFIADVRLVFHNSYSTTKRTRRWEATTRSSMTNSRRSWASSSPAAARRSHSWAGGRRPSRPASHLNLHSCLDRLQACTWTRPCEV